MYLYLVHKIKVLRLTDLEFFKAAHQWAFGHCPIDLMPDVMQFRQHQVIPKYVVSFVEHLKETSCK